MVLLAIPSPSLLMDASHETAQMPKRSWQKLISKDAVAVSPEIRAWLKGQKPKTAEELRNLANLRV